MHRNQNVPGNAAHLRLANRLHVSFLLLSLLSAGCAATGGSQKYSGLMYQTVDSFSYPILYPAMLDAAREGLPPMPVTFTVADAAKSDYRLDLAFGIRDQRISDTEAVWHITTLLLLGMYPSTCGRYEFILTAKLEDREGRHLRSWQLIESDTAFSWMLAGPNCEGPTEESVRKVAVSLLADLYVDMAKDPLLAGPAPSAAYPLVFIDAGEQQAIVERAVWTEMPFPKVTFDSEQRKNADRLVQIALEYSVPNQGLGSIMGRTGAAIMTIGLVSPCSPNRIILRASVRDADGVVLNTYESVDKVRGSMIDDCALAPGMHPEAETKLLKRVFRRMAKDMKHAGRGPSADRLQ